jgi:hypothetical protein
MAIQLVRFKRYAIAIVGMIANGDTMMVAAL